MTSHHIFRGTLVDQLACLESMHGGRRGNMRSSPRTGQDTWRKGVGSDGRRRHRGTEESANNDFAIR